MRFHFYSTFENYLWHINTLILYNGIEWNVVIVGIYFSCLEAVFHLIYTLLWRNKINQIRGEISFSFDTWKLLVAYKHTYFVQRYRMPCGHGRNWFYVPRSYFHFIYALFWRAVDQWHTRWDFIFIRHLKTASGMQTDTYFAQRNRTKCGHSRHLFYVSRSYFSFYLLSFVTHLNNWNTLWDFMFIGHVKTTCGI